MGFQDPIEIVSMLDDAFGIHNAEEEKDERDSIASIH